MPLDLIAFDGDDTLWHNESIFRLSQDRFKALMADVADAAQALAGRNAAFFAITDTSIAEIRSTLGPDAGSLAALTGGAVFELSDAMKYDEARAKLATYPPIYQIGRAHV